MPKVISFRKAAQRRRMATPDSIDVLIDAMTSPWVPCDCPDCLPHHHRDQASDQQASANKPRSE